MLTKEQLDELERADDAMRTATAALIVAGDRSGKVVAKLAEKLPGLIAQARRALELEAEVERLRNIERDNQEEELFKRDWGR